VAGGARPHTGTTDTAIGYSGNWTDPDTGLVYLRARDYDAATAQFLQVDPAVDSTRQPYAYVANDPLTRTDPTGLDFWGDFGKAALGFGAGLLDGATGVCRR
jgi:RHS repeat-associated protein